MNGKSGTNANYVLGVALLNLGGGDVGPIMGFRATLNGRGNTVLWVMPTPAFGVYPTNVGLFGTLASPGSISNLVIAGNMSGYDNAGLAVGLLSGGTLTNVSTSGRLFGFQGNFSNYVFGHSIGGLVGNNEVGVIAGCSSSVNIDNGGASAFPYLINVGGLVGRNHGLIFQSYATGSVATVLWRLSTVGLATCELDAQCTISDFYSTTTAFGGIIKWANAGTVQNGYSLNTFANSLVTSYGGPSWVFAANYYSSQASASTAPSVANSTTSLGQMPAGFSTSIRKIDTVLARPVFVWASVTAST